jgi:hypothetical protein
MAGRQGTNPLPVCDHDVIVDIFAMYRNAFVWLIVAIALTLSGCSSSWKPLPVQSEISTYDTTFTGKIDRSAVGSRKSVASLAYRNPFDWGRWRKSHNVQSQVEKPYFVEFRARKALSYGHASVVFGKLDANGNIPVDKNGVLDPKRVQVSGLHPASSDPAQWAKGHMVPVPAETGPSDGDFEDAYVTARYRIDLTEAEFRKLVSIVRRHRASYPYWYAPNYATNCLGYIGSIAQDMGLTVPTVPTMPKQYVQRLKSLNSRSPRLF